MTAAPRSSEPSVEDVRLLDAETNPTVAVPSLMNTRPAGRLSTTWKLGEVPSGTCTSSRYRMISPTATRSVPSTFPVKSSDVITIDFVLANAVMVIPALSLAE